MNHKINQFNIVISTLDSFLAEHEPNNQKEIDLLVIDVQGFEHEVLKGSTFSLTRTNAVYTEVTFDPSCGIYNGITPGQVIYDGLTSLGFTPILETYRPFGNSGHGNLLFIKHKAD